MTIFSDIPGRVQLLDESHQPFGSWQPCRFNWAVEPKSWAVAVLTRHEFQLEDREASYIGIYSEDGELMFISPLVGRPVSGGSLIAFPGEDGGV